MPNIDPRKLVTRGPGSKYGGKVSKKHVDQYVKKGYSNPVLASVGPDGRLYVHDGKHRVTADLIAGRKTKVKIVKDAQAAQDDCSGSFCLLFTLLHSWTLAGWLLMHGPSSAVARYRAELTQLTPPCPHPVESCSAYAARQLAELGPVRGSWAAAVRIWRCRS